MIHTHAYVNYSMRTLISSIIHPFKFYAFVYLFTCFSTFYLVAFFIYLSIDWFIYLLIHFYLFIFLTLIPPYFSFTISLSLFYTQNLWGSVSWYVHLYVHMHRPYYTVQCSAEQILWEPFHLLHFNYLAILNSMYFLFDCYR